MQIEMRIQHRGKYLKIQGVESVTLMTLTLMGTR